MDSGDSNIMRFSSYIDADGDTFFEPLSSSLYPPISSHLPPFFNSSPTAPTTPPTPSLPSGAPRISKKRSRPSRRAPTTVLVTDTSNFRAMVQVFTGIPSAPLPSSFPLQTPLNFSSPLLLHPYSPNLQSTDSSALTSSLSSNYQSPINAQQSSSSNLLQYIPPFASSEALLTPEKFGVIRGVDGLVSLAGSDEAEDDLRGEKGSELGHAIGLQGRYVGVLDLFFGS